LWFPFFYKVLVNTIGIQRGFLF